MNMRHHLTYLHSPSASVFSPKVGCASCSVRTLCLPHALDEFDTERFNRTVKHRFRVLRGEHLYHVGDRTHDAFYMLRVGHFKTYHLDPDGKQRVTGFQTCGDMLGVDAIGLEQHRCSAIALSDSEVCAVHCDGLKALCGGVSDLQQQVYNLLCREVVREQNIALLLRNTPAERRLAVFLNSMSLRSAARGCSASQFELPMSRQDIGSYLGLTGPSVSRILWRLKDAGCIDVVRRSIVVRDADSLRRVAAGTAVPSCGTLPHIAAPQLGTARQRAY